MPDVQEQIDAIEAEMVSTNNFNEGSEDVFFAIIMHVYANCNNAWYLSAMASIVMHYCHLVQSLSYLQLSLALNDNIYFRYSSY